MVGAARRLATELVVISAKATQEIHTAVGTFGRATSLISAAHCSPIPEVRRRGFALWAGRCDTVRGEELKTLYIPLPSIT